MNRSNSPLEQAVNDYRLRFRWLWLAAAGCALFVISVLVILGRHDDDGAGRQIRADGAASSRPLGTANPEPAHGEPSFHHSERISTPEPTPEQVIAQKVQKFGLKRRQLVRAIARSSKKEVPAEIERFFDALERGEWEEINSQWHELAVHSGQYDYSTNHWEWIDPFWPTVLDAYGVAEQAHNWPAQQLLDYGNAVLAALRPGMVYVGGTDPGRWIPELLNETAGGEEHIMITQNAFADGRYLDFLNTLYRDQMQTLTTDDSQRAFQEYLMNAKQRFEHDQQFPDEPKQILPGENVQIVDGQIHVTGAAAVMAVNEKLLEALMQKNPDMSFAIQESYPLQGTYGDALPLGPLMELNASNGQNGFTEQRAAQSLDFLRNTTQQVLSDFDATGSEEVLKTYSHEAVSAANLLAAHNFESQAEEAYRLAVQLCPASPESVAGLANLIAANGKEAEARQLINDFVQKYPDQQKTLDQITAGMKIIATMTPKP